MRGFGHYFWGIFLILAGLLFVLKYHFNWNIPTGRVIVGMAFVTLGLSIMLGGYSYGLRSDNQLIFNSGVLQGTVPQKEYNIIFSNGTIDLSSMAESSWSGKMELNTVFGSTTLILPKDLPVTIKAHAAFSSTVFPDRSNLTFGERQYKVGYEESDVSGLVIETNTVFGRLDIQRK